MPAQRCLIGWPSAAIETLLADLGGSLETIEQARRINDEVRQRLAGAVQGISDTLAGPARAFEATLARQFEAAGVIAARGDVLFGGPEFAETWRFWARAMPDLRPLLFIPPPPDPGEGEMLNHWLRTSVTGLQQTAGQAPVVCVGATESWRRAMSSTGDSEGGTPAIIITGEEGEPALDWLDSPVLPAPASMLYLGLQLLAARDPGEGQLNSLLLELADAVDCRWRAETRASAEIDAARIMQEDLRAAYAGAEERVTSLRRELARTADERAEADASYQWKLESADHQRRYLEAQLAEAHAYIASIRRTPVYRGFTAARAARDRLRSLMARH